MPSNTTMPKPLSREDQTLLRLLKTPPKPFTPKVKPKASPKRAKQERKP